MKGQAASQVGQNLYPYTRNNPDLTGYAAVAAGTVVGFFAIVLLAKAILPEPGSTSPAPVPAPPTNPLTQGLGS